MILWSAGIVLALGLAWFVGAVVVPVWQVRRAIEAPSALNGAGATFGATVIGRLGGPEKAIAKIGIYLRLPEYIAKDRWAAAGNLRYCGSRAVPLLIMALRHNDAEVRSAAAIALAQMEPAPTEAAAALAVALHDQAPGVRLHAVWALAEMGPAARDSIPALERTLTDTEAQIRLAAAEALKKIRGEETPE
jgi:HEAT repeat protein